MEINSFEIRDKINTAFNNAKIPVVVATVKKTQNQNITITTIDKNNADELLLHKNIWTPILDNPIEITKDKQWFSLMAHGINTKYQDMSLIKNDIETFNPGIVLLTNPKWIHNLEKTEKQYSTLVLNVDQESFKIARKGLNILGIRAKTECFRH